MFEIITASNKDKDFYLMMGKFFGKRHIAKEVGINLYDDDDKIWFIALSSHNVIGFALLKNNLISDCYVLNEHRNNKVFSRILNSIIANKSKKYLANCTKLSLNCFINAGFEIASKSKNYTRVMLCLN